MKVQEVIDIINDPNECLYSIHDAENLISSVTGKELERIDYNTSINESGWHIISVYKVEDRFVGITVSQLKNDEENTRCIAEEFELGYKLTYIPKK